MREALLTLLFAILSPALVLEARTDWQIDREVTRPPHALAGEGRWRGPDGSFLPFTEDAEVLEFLRDARIVKSKEIHQGINRPLKVLLRSDDVEAHAIFRTVDERQLRYVIGDQVYLGFHDSYVYECAAYEVNRLLGLDNVPPCVLREVNGRKGSMQLWIENAMTEEKRRRTRQVPPSSIEWERQQQVRRLFDALIYNFDRNQGNLLIDEDWKLWLVDHTRSFHGSSRVQGLEKVRWCEYWLWARLVLLGREAVEQRLSGLVEQRRIDDLLARRDAIVEHLAGRVIEGLP